MPEAVEPFLIRGHHLRNLKEVLEDGPKETVLKLVSALLSGFHFGDETGKRYATDIMGTIDNTDAFTRNEEAVYQAFLNLPEDHPINIVIGRPDAMCQTCVFGLHCRQKIQIGFPAGTTNMVWADSDYVKAFIGVASNLALEFTLAEDLVLFSDSPEPEVVKRVITTAQVTRAVLVHGLPPLDV